MNFIKLISFCLLILSCTSKNDLIKSGRIIYNPETIDTMIYQYHSIFDEYGKKSKTEYIILSIDGNDTLRHIIYYNIGDSMRYTYYLKDVLTDNYYKDCIVKDYPTSDIEFNIATYEIVLNDFTIDSVKYDTIKGYSCKTIFYNFYGDQNMITVHKNVALGYEQNWRKMSVSSVDFECIIDSSEFFLPRFKKICIGPSMIID